MHPQRPPPSCALVVNFVKIIMFLLSEVREGNFFYLLVRSFPVLSIKINHLHNLKHIKHSLRTHYIDTYCQSRIISAIKYRVFRKNVIFPRIFSILRPLLRQHWAAIGCTKNGPPIGVTVHSHYFDNIFESLLMRSPPQLIRLCLSLLVNVQCDGPMDLII